MTCSVRGAVRSDRAAVCAPPSLWRVSSYNQGTDRPPDWRNASLQLVAQFEVASEETAAAVCDVAARGGGGVGWVLQGDEASWRGRFQNTTRVVCVHHTMFGVNINTGAATSTTELWRGNIYSCIIIMPVVVTCACRA
jgi:hypothetical protein